MLRNNSEFLLILSILLSIYGRTDIKKSLFFALLTADCRPRMLNGYAPEYVSSRMAFVRKADIEKMFEGNPYKRVIPASKGKLSKKPKAEKV